MTDNMNELSERLLSATIGDRSAEVSFRGRGLKLDTEQDAKDVVEAISRCPDLETLCLEGNTLGVDAAKAVGKALEAQPKLRRALWKDLFTGRSKEVIPDALRFLTGGVMLSHARLTELDLSDNAFGPVGIGALVPLLSSPCCFQLKARHFNTSLNLRSRTLLLNNNGLGPGGAELLAKALGACLAESRKAGTPLQLRTLVCGRNRLENVGATALAAVLADMGSLEELSLPQNGIFHEGVGALAKGVAANPNLHLLNLNDNIFTPEGARQMAQASASIIAVRRLDKLEVLNFGDCLVKTAGAKALAKGLAEGSSPLRASVQLGYNGISLSGGSGPGRSPQGPAPARGLGARWEQVWHSRSGAAGSSHGCGRQTGQAVCLQRRRGFLRRRRRRGRGSQRCRRGAARQRRGVPGISHGTQAGTARESALQAAAAAR
ncbi:unnamed protein product [Ixodes pacificus]